jgi:hypothetical protein
VHTVDIDAESRWDMAVSGGLSSRKLRETPGAAPVAGCLFSRRRKIELQDRRFGWDFRDKYLIDNF